MFGSLPKLHRWTLVAVCGVAGAVLGAWVSSLVAVNGEYSCSEVMLGVCVGGALNLLPIVAGTALGLLTALVLVYDPHDPHRRSP